jgi:hypothetical protein
MGYKKFAFIIVILVSLHAGNVFSQIRVSSPYSRYGIGDLQNNKYLRNISMGGISYGYRNSSCVNYTNPASYTAFDTTSFVFETGVNSHFFQLNTTDLKQFSNYTSLAYLVFGFPVTKWWGASMGILPYSSVGYKISNYETRPDIGRIKYLYEGAGGLNQFYIGNAFKVKNFSFGFNASYVFGYLDKTSTVSFPDSVYFLAMRSKNSTLVNDFLFTYGVQYQKALIKDVKICLGAALNVSSKLHAQQDSLAYVFLTSGGLETIKDTIVNSNSIKGKLVLPMGFGGGFTIGKTDKLTKADRWLFGVDYQMQDWKNYSLFGEKDSLKNSWMISAGAEFTPKNTTGSGYFKYVHYRLGARYNQTYLQLRNNQLNEYAVSVGFGFPLKRLKTTLNLGFEYGERGTLDNNLIKEQFGRVVLSLSVYERWFIKHRFD